MSKKSIYSYYTKLYKVLLRVKFLNKLNINKDKLEESIKSNKFVKEFSDIFYTGDFSCKRVTRLFGILFKEDRSINLPSWSEDQWLNYFYQYNLSKAFSSAVTITLDPSLDPYCEFYLKMLKAFNEYEKEINTELFTSKYPLIFLSNDEIDPLEYPEEYEKFLMAFNEESIYELMKLNKEITGYNTLDHICGVHHLAINIGRQLKYRGLELDLGRVSGSAAGHDIGKFGCIGEEVKRVPYLHYYYSDQWFLKHNIHYIRNVAVNHSTWDLELENLSLESLILIYSDFRVKNLEGAKIPTMHIYSLEDSFNIILNKLDNLNEAKELRYKRVYSKLLDFHDFLLRLGINISEDYSLNTPSSSFEEIPKEYSLLQGNKVTENIKDLAINHNISLMYTLRDEYSLEAILEKARSEKSWKKLRVYIKIFEEYSTYLTENQKIQTLRFLYENLIHPEDDIRKDCGKIIGTLIAFFDEDYRKELPGNVVIPQSSLNSYALFDEYINKLLYPSHKLINQHKYWLGYNLSMVCKSLFNSLQRPSKEYRDIFISYCDGKKLKNSDMYLFLLRCIKYIPLDTIDDNIHSLIDFVVNSAEKKNISLRLAALEVIIYLFHKLKNDDYFQSKVTNYLSLHSGQATLKAEEYLLQKLIALSEDRSFECLNCTSSVITNIYLNNLKSATDWMVKKINIDLLNNYILTNKGSNPLQAAIHFSNLLKVSAVEGVRDAAGNAIVAIMPKLTSFEKNEVAVELLRALEIEGTKFTQYIPKYLGKALLYLEYQELEEIFDDLLLKIKSSNGEVKALLLKTASITLEEFLSKINVNSITKNNKNMLTKLLGILLNGLGDYDNQISSAAFSFFAKSLFQSKLLTLEKKYFIYKLTAKKLLTLISPDYKNNLLLLSNSAALNQVYKFISEYSFQRAPMDLSTSGKIAFFPGTFDPFSLSHKEIALRIRDLGFEVYLAVDEFSWSKKTLPNLIRRNIINMTMASELNIYLYPDNKPINLSNPKDLYTLKNSFNTSSVYIVTGSDVILNASSYKKEAEKGSIHEFNHIVILRGRAKDLKKKLQTLTGDVVLLNLSVKTKDISSSQIRNYIDDNKDISTLIDPLAQKYIYENGFYQREPLEKDEFTSMRLETELIENIGSSQLELLTKNFSLSNTVLKELFKNRVSSSSIIILKELGKDNLLGFAVSHWIKTDMLYDEIQDIDISRHIRDNTTGRILSLDMLILKNNDRSSYYQQLLLTEILAHGAASDYQYALCNISKGNFPQGLLELLEDYGFTPIHEEDASKSFRIVNISNPCVVNYDIENFIKEPFRSSSKVKGVIAHTRKALQKALCRLYPGELVLPIDTSMLHYGLIKKICSLNSVRTQENSSKGVKHRQLGDLMCVPYGDILDRYLIPNTVTKALHTEKYFNPDMKSFKIDSFPYFLTLENQIKILKSFDMPVILVDTILHKGYRMKALDPLLTSENVEVNKLVVGILSARGKDLMEYQNRKVEAVYFIPRLKLWFNESSLYPFIGGDSLWRGSLPKRNLLPSVNLILPYTSPSFMRGIEKESILELSKTSIENSKLILSELEEAYHRLNERNLSLLSLGQVITIPRFPDHGKDILYDLNLTPTHYLNNDLELLDKLEDIIRR